MKCCLDDKEIHWLPITVRTHGLLRRHGIITAGDIRSRTDQELLGMHGIGPKILAEIREAVRCGFEEALQ